MIPIFHHLKITHRFTIALLVAGVLPLLGAGLVSYHTTQSALIEQFLAQQQELLINYREQLELTQEQIENLVANIASDQTINQVLQLQQNSVVSSSYQRLSTQAQVGHILNSYINVKGLVSIHVLGNGDSHFQVGDTLTVRDQPGVREQILATLEQQESWIYWPGVIPNLNAGSREAFVLPAVKALYRFNRQRLERERIGLVVANYSIQGLLDKFSQRARESGFPVFLIDQQDRFIVHPDPAMVGQPASTELQQKSTSSQPSRIDGQDYYMVSELLDHTGWKLISTIPVSATNQAANLIRDVSVLSFTIALLIAALFAIIFSRTVIVHIQQVTDAFRRLKSGASDIPKLPVAGNDEISQLAQWFNLFLDELKVKHQYEEALRISEERYEMATHATQEGIWDYDNSSDTIYCSDRFQQITGLNCQDDTASPAIFFQMMHPDDKARIKASYTAFLKSNDTVIKLEYRILRPDGSSAYLRNNCRAVRDEHGRVIRTVGSIQDISAQKSVEQRLHHDASHDPLTGLHNRTWMIKRIDREIQSSNAEQEKSFAVFFIDLDNFKTLNDTLGHSTGDLLLIQMAERIESCLRPGDALARLGGDEFIVLLPEISSSDTVIVVERLVREIAVPFQLNSHRYETHASIGIAFSKSGYRNAEEILRDADTAMYRAKSEGKGRYEIFDDQMRRLLLERTTLEHELIVALKEQQLEMYYQPILDLSNDSIVGFEALLRWNHPTRTISPEQFIPVAEEAQLIEPMGDWIFQQVAQQVALWQRLFVLPERFRVAVNFSPQQFGNTRLIDKLNRTMAETGAKPSNISVELTETAIFSDKQVVQRYLQQLQALDILIYLDDFGTGYSSLSYLNSFPIDAIKIDRSFVSGLASDQRKKQLVNMMVLLAQELGISVIAEGVETEEVMAYLKSRGCSYAQGYFIQRPMAADAATRLLSDNLTGIRLRI